MGDRAGEGVYAEVRAERERAHAKHGDTSMEAFPTDDMNRLAILTEEVGEVAKEFNEARHRHGVVDLPALRKELIQTAAMAVAWADAIEGGSLHGRGPTEKCPRCKGGGTHPDHDRGCPGGGPICEAQCPVEVLCAMCRGEGVVPAGSTTTQEDDDVSGLTGVEAE